MINREEIVKIVAEKHKLIIGYDDPILSVFAISDALYEMQNEKMLAIHATESQKLVKIYESIAKERRLEQRRDFEALLHAIKNENLRHEAEKIEISRQHVEAITRLTAEAKKSESWTWLVAVAVSIVAAGFVVYACPFRNDS